MPEITRLIHRNPSVVSREVNRNRSKNGVYSAVEAHENIRNVEPCAKRKNFSIILS